MLLDTAVFNFLYGDGDPLFARHQQMKILIINEILAQFEYSGESRPELYYYRSRGGAEVDLILRHKDHLIAIDISI
jgi:predicted AAA+ superfamily ATPase